MKKYLHIKHLEKLVIMEYIQRIDKYIVSQKAHIVTLLILLRLHTLIVYFEFFNTCENRNVVNNVIIILFLLIFCKFFNKLRLSHCIVLIVKHYRI